MSRRGILLEHGDVRIEVKRDASGIITGGLVLGESDYEHIALILESNKGDFKDYPVLGVGGKYLKSVGRASQMRADIKTQLELDGYKADVEVSEDGKLTIEV